MTPKTYILGGHQTDFGYNWSRHGHGLWDIFENTVVSAFEAARIEPKEVEVAHIGNFSSEAFCQQNLLGGFFASVHPDLAGVPTTRHEAACAAGSAALLSASAEIEAGRYDLACVMGVEKMRHVPGQMAADIIGYCAWNGQEAEDAKYVWPHMFSKLVDVYDERYGVDDGHLHAISEKNYTNAKKNPNAQTYKWKLPEGCFGHDDEKNPHVEGRLRRYDCSQVTDGGAAIFVASETYAAEYAKRNGLELSALPYLKGWGHRTAPMRFADKLAQSGADDYVFPHVRGTIEDAYRRAGLAGPDGVDVIETHDCFSITEYMAIEHFGLTGPGRGLEAIEDGRIAPGGALPINPSGGLMGGGHPVGATGVRMALDAFKQTTGAAGDYQVEGAKTMATLNIGGSATASISLIIGVD